ncbi:polyprenyl synthetase family protein [Actinomadura rubrisoli]|uniref:Polyprenyl synthetase family protein n=1 Tax=Actinomadura rubrisoli TaxID=2530368 RepID=A0A4R4ZSS4_9ACTN|nr:polyprenyl synthetase family protein [Actinomadura rubrisoli]TDD61430.1 polyprenyl synthetase family protein [Actinomadura rubrisoli]
MNAERGALVQPSTGRLRARIDDVLTTFLGAQLYKIGDREIHTVFTTVTEFILHGGKRIRPVLCYWGWRGAGGGEGQEILRVAAALEVFHAFCLIHDDIMDGSDLRRGRPTVHRVLADRHARSRRRGNSERFGAASAILLGDLCMTWADELLRTSGLDAPRLATAHRHYNRMRSELFYGQYLDMLEQSRGPSCAGRSMTIVRYKTAKYTAERPLQLGGVLAGASPALLAAYSGFGLALGEAFQLRDDLLGAFGDPAVTGKPSIDDFRQGKPTVLIAHALRRAAPAQRRLIDALYGTSQIDEAGAGRLREVLRDTGAVAAVEAMIAERGERALSILTTAPVHPSARQALSELTTAALHRTA